MTTLARKLHLIDYFALGFGVMVGAAWLVVMDDILERGGPLGAILGFTLGALTLFPIGYVYGKLVRAIPDAAGEVAYTAKVFPRGVSFVTGWMMLLSYFLTCPFEAIAAGKIAGYLFPAIDSIELYRLGGRPIYFWRVVLGLTITALLTWLNYRGIQASARFLKWTTFTFLSLVVIFATEGFSHGSISNLRPLFSHSPLISVLLVWQITPWFLTGFESVGKGAEEASPDFQGRNFMVAIQMTIFVALVFFAVVIAAVAYVAPWQSLTHEKFPTAVAFERALHARWIVNLILGAAFIALLKAFNGNVVASSRMLFAMGRRNLLDQRLGMVHLINQTPSVAVLGVGVATAVAFLMGEALLVPILEVGAVGSAIGWMAACGSYYCMKPSLAGRAAAIYGVLLTSVMVLVKIVPLVPGHFTASEWISMTIWGLFGYLLWTRRHELPEEHL
ncbi:MAG TPA: APC family permease [Candidatus Udaeobacter sp.]|jgi:basic amino acid/polyamine antiporter, APA family|nr:APC family permease [Candidatus Udaeobacter sp.]